MKITAEFNSNEELINFISTFGAKTFKPEQGASTPTKESKKTTDIQKVENTKKETPKVEVTKENKKEDVKKEDKEEVTQADTKATEDVKEDKKEDLKITKEMVRAIFTKLIKAGKQKEAKEITEKYGAKRLPDLAEEHYEAAYKDVEGLL